MTVKKCWIEDGCIGCDACVAICPDVFEIPSDVCIVKPGADLAANSDSVIEAAEGCPVEVIKYQE